LLVLILAAASSHAQESWAEKMFKWGTTRDFGTVPRGAQLVHQFKMENIYAEPLEITTRVSCGCVTATPSVKVLQPQQTGTIDILMDARKFQGQKTVVVEVTVGPKYVSTARLTVSGNSRVDVVLNPGQINFNLIAAGQSPPAQSLDVEYAGALDWHATGLDKHDAPLEASYAEIYRRPGHVGYRVNVSLKPANIPPGPFKYEIFLKTNDQTGPLIPILVEGTLQAPLTVVPNPLKLSRLKVGEKSDGLVLVKAGKPFHVLAVEGLEDGITVDFPTNESPVHVVRFHCQPSKPGALHKQVSIKTDLDKDPQVTVTVEGAVQK